VNFENAAYDGHGDELLYLHFGARRAAAESDNPQDACATP
jgi:hypothetical protein